MQTNIFFNSAAALSDDDLLARLQTLARKEREASIEPVAHLAVLDTRPVLYAADGYGSLFSYCTQALRLSEDAACNRVEAARACRRFPHILELLAAGMLSLRYRVQFTIGQGTQEKLRRLQALLRREIPDGDPGAIFDRAISLLLEKVERKKLGKAARPRPRPVIRPGTDSDAAEGLLPPREYAIRSGQCSIKASKQADGRVLTGTDKVSVAPGARATRCLNLA